MVNCQQGPSVALFVHTMSLFGPAVPEKETTTILNKRLQGVISPTHHHHHHHHRPAGTESLRTSKSRNTFSVNKYWHRLQTLIWV